MPARLSDMRIPLDGFLQGNQAMLQGGLQAAQSIQRGYEAGSAGIARGLHSVAARKEREEARAQQESQFSRSMTQRQENFAAGLAMQYRGQSIDMAYKTGQMRIGQLRGIDAQMKSASERMEEIATDEWLGTQSPEYQQAKQQYDTFAQQRVGLADDLNSVFSSMQSAARDNTNMATIARTGTPAYVDDVMPYVEGETPAERSRNILSPSSPDYGGRDGFRQRKQRAANPTLQATSVKPVTPGDAPLTPAEQKRAYKALPKFAGGGLSGQRMAVLDKRLVDYRAEFVARQPDMLEEVAVFKAVDKLSRDEKAPKWARDWARKIRHPAEITMKQALDTQLGQVKSHEHNMVVQTLNAPELVGLPEREQLIGSMYGRLAEAKTPAQATRIGAEFQGQVETLLAERKAQSTATETEGEAEQMQAQAQHLARATGANPATSLRVLNEFGGEYEKAKGALDVMEQKRYTTAWTKTQSDVKRAVLEQNMRSKTIAEYERLIAEGQNDKAEAIRAQMADRSPALADMMVARVKAAQGGKPMKPVLSYTPAEVAELLRIEMGQEGFDLNAVSEDELMQYAEGLINAGAAR